MGNIDSDLHCNELELSGYSMVHFFKLRKGGGESNFNERPSKIDT